jgi:hypothetical protein
MVKFAVQQYIIRRWLVGGHSNNVQCTRYLLPTAHSAYVLYGIYNALKTQKERHQVQPMAV